LGKHNPAMKNLFIENDYLKLWYEEDILHIEYQPNLSINLFVASEIIDLLKKVCNKNNYCLVQDVSNLKWIDRESRDFFAREECTGLMKAWAYFSKNPIHKIMYLMYTSFSNPQAKTKFFTNKKDAIKWLKKYI
jgi:hypothetical protein